MMNRKEVMQVLRRHVTTEIVVSTYSCALDWLDTGERELNYFSHGAMGLGSSHGLGLALARPERKTVVLDGDGSLLMNLGTLVSIAAQSPPNLVLICFQNDTYEANGGHPIPQASAIDFARIARSAGIARSSTIEELAELGRRLPDILSAPGPTFVTLRIVQGPARPGGGYEHLYTPERRAALRRALGPV
jgi:thiamine pyrophosphate-dependent acetolactate synthase large subunit-like protein